MDDWRAELGPIGTALVDGVRDICVDGFGRAWVDSGHGFVDSGLVLTATDVRRIGTSLIERGGGRVDDARPVGDASLAGRARVHLALPPIARHGPLLSVRIPAQVHPTLDSFRFSSDAARMACVTESVLVAGVTGSGKTTLASALLAQRPAHHRLVIIEDIAELDPLHPHCVHLASRAANPDGGGEVALGRLVTEALRMRPDSLVVGEIRGTEIGEFFAALTAGHHGISTVHARALEDVPARLTVLCLRAGIPLNAVAPLIVSAVPLVALCTRNGAGVDVTVGRTAVAGSDLVVTQI